MGYLAGLVFIGTGVFLINPVGAEMDLPSSRCSRSASGKSTSLKERMEKLKEADRQTQESTGKKRFSIVLAILDNTI